MSSIKDLLLEFESTHGRNVDCRRFVNFFIRGGMMADTPQSTPQPTPQPTPQSMALSSPLHQREFTKVSCPTKIRLLIISVTSKDGVTGDNTSRSFIHWTHTIGGRRVIQINNIHVQEFLKNKSLTDYTHIIIIGHCHNPDGYLCNDDDGTNGSCGQRYKITNIMTTIRQRQRSKCKLFFYNCQSYTRILKHEENNLYTTMFEFVTEAFFVDNDAKRFGNNIIFTRGNAQKLSEKINHPFAQWLPIPNRRNVVREMNIMDLLTNYFYYHSPNDTTSYDLPSPTETSSASPAQHGAIPESQAQMIDNPNPIGENGGSATRANDENDTNTNGHVHKRSKLARTVNTARTVNRTLRFPSSDEEEEDNSFGMMKNLDHLHSNREQRKSQKRKRSKNDEKDNSDHPEDF